MRRVLITGGTGFVGANLARRMLDEHEVHLLVRPGFTAWRIDGIRSEVRLHEVGLEDADGVGRVVAAIRPEWIFHLATYGAYSRQADVHRMASTNILGTINLVQASCQFGFEVFVNTGSSSEYGVKDHAPAETEWLEPNSPYAVTKASATLFCRLAAQRHGVRIATLRLYSVYGPYEEPDRLLPTLVLRGLDGNLPPLVDPDVARDYIHVDDVCEAYLLAASHPAPERGPVYNVGTGIQTTLRDVVDVARRILPIGVEPQWGSMPRRVWDTGVWISDSRRIRADLGWQPRVQFEEGLRSTVDWFRAHPELVGFYRSRSAEA
jgi:nucleoside-diphosphate-sugar epimerase